MADRSVLIVDDEVDLLESLQTRFDMEGYLVLVAGDGEKAMEIIKSNSNIDVIVLDIMMPNMDGYTFLKEMRKIPGFKDTPVVIVSAKEKSKMGDLFFFEKIAAYMEKPFDGKLLVEKIGEILNKSC